MSIIDGEDLDDSELDAFGLFSEQEGNEETREIDFDADELRELGLTDEDED